MAVAILVYTVSGRFSACSHEPGPIGDQRHGGNQLLQTMKTAPNCLARCTWLRTYAAMFLTLFASVRAQQSKPAPITEDAVQLSPFIVDASADSGYRSSVTQSGSRLRADIKDVAASITVLTSDFMDDLGATDLAGALALVAGAENDSTQDPTNTAAFNAGYVGGDFGDVNTRSGQVNVRGLGSASISANYIGVISAPDRYNIERAEFLRGANSILFGLASPAGLVNSTTKVANMKKNINNVQAVVDNFGSMRTVLDLSRVLLKNKLALRVVGMNSNQQYKVKKAFQDDERLFLTNTYQPSKNTLVRASAEFTKNHGRRPNFRTVQDNVSGWLALYNQYAKILTPAQLATAFTWNPATSAGLPGNSIVTANGQSVDLGLLRLPIDGSKASYGSALFYSSSNATAPDGGAFTILGARTSTGALPPVATQAYFVRSSSPLENRTGYVDPQVTDTGIFPYNTVELSALPGNFRWEKGRKLNLSIDQRITDNLFLSAAFQRETFSEEHLFSPISQTQQIDIDLNVTLPNGRPNPNLLRPFVYGRNIGEHNDEVLDNLLVEANYDFDFAQRTRSLGWLGRHRLTGLYTRTSDNRLTYRWNLQIANQPAGVGAALGDGTHSIYQVWYVGDPVQAGDTSLRLTGFPTSTMALSAGQTLPISYFNSATNAWQLSPTPATIDRQLINAQRAYTRQINDGVSSSLQSFFWKQRIVTLLGIRKDSVDYYNNGLNTAVQPFLGASRTDYSVSGSPTFTNSRTTSTQSVVFHATHWLSFSATQSRNFAATAPRFTPLWQPIPPQNGKTGEVGFGLSLFGNKLDLRASYYNTSQHRATATNATSTASLYVSSTESFLYNALEGANRLAEWYTYGPNGKTTDLYVTPLGASGTRNSVAKGYQIEIFYSPNAEWRMALNFNEVETTATDIGSEVREFLAVRASYYGKYVQEGLRADGTTNAKPSNATLFATTLTNSLVSNYLGNSSMNGTSNPGVAKYALKYVTSYSFHRDWLKGFAVGGNASWQSHKVMGYRQKGTIYDIGGLNGISGVVADASNPVLGPAVVTGGMFVKYGRKILNDRMTWKIQLNAQNLLGEQGLRQIAANPNGSAVWGVAPSRFYQLSNSFDF